MLSTVFFFHHPNPPTWITCSRSSKRRLKSWCWQYSTTGRCWAGESLDGIFQRFRLVVVVVYVWWISGESHISGESPDLLGCFFLFPDSDKPKIHTEMEGKLWSKGSRQWRHFLGRWNNWLFGTFFDMNQPSETFSLCRVAWSSNGTSCRQWKLSNCPNTGASKISSLCALTLCIFSARSMNIIYVIWICSAC